MSVSQDPSPESKITILDCSLDLNSIKCRINEGCFFALGSYAGFKLQKVHQEDDSGADFRLIRQLKRNGRICDGSTILDFQLKATQEWKDSKKYIRYDIESKTYNDIVTRNREEVVPLLLILMCLPKGEEDWVLVSRKNLQFRKCLFWYHTDSLELLENENSTKAIRVPKKNILDETSFKAVVETYGIRRQ